MKKMIIGVIGFLMLPLMIGGGHAASIEVSGWNFTLNLNSLDGWRASEYQTILPYDSSSPDWKPSCEVGGAWIGVTSTAFVYPAFPNAQVGEEGGTGWAYISVFKIPDNLKKQEVSEILSYATRNTLSCKNFDSDKDITFDGHKAHLSEGDTVSFKISDGAIAILLDDDTVGLIDVSVFKEPREKGDAIFNGSA